MRDMILDDVYVGLPVRKMVWEDIMSGVYDSDTGNQYFRIYKAIDKPWLIRISHNGFDRRHGFEANNCKTIGWLVQRPNGSMYLDNKRPRL